MQAGERIESEIDAAHGINYFSHAIHQLPMSHGDNFIYINQLKLEQSESFIAISNKAWASWLYLFDETIWILFHLGYFVSIPFANLKSNLQQAGYSTG